MRVIRSEGNSSYHEVSVAESLETFHCFFCDFKSINLSLFVEETEMNSSSFGARLGKETHPRSITVKSTMESEKVEHMLSPFLT
jgi:hypothetical protein